MKSKVKLILFIIFVSLISCGCTLNYNLTIKEDLSIIDDVSVTEKNSVLKTKYDDYKKQISNYQKFYKNHDLYSSFESKKIYKSDYSGLELYRTYEYGKFENSPNYSTLFQNYSFLDQGDYYTLKLNYAIKENIFPDIKDNNEKIDEAYINIKSHLLVVETNSDTYDEKTKTYTWKLDDDFFNNNDGIYMKISKEKDSMLIFMDFFKEHTFEIIFTAVIILSIIVISLLILIKYKKGLEV